MIFCEPDRITFNNSRIQISEKYYGRYSSSQEDLTEEKALSILKEISIKSSVKSFLTKPSIVTILSQAAAISSLGLVDYFYGSSSKAKYIAFPIMAFGVASVIFVAIKNRALQQLSNYYAEVSKSAREDMNIITTRMEYPNVGLYLPS